jgi:hypothetical protein
VAASAKSTPCFRRLNRAFAGSHSTSTGASVCTHVHQAQPAAPNRRLERPGERSRRHSRPVLGAGRSTARRWAASPSPSRSRKGDKK